MRRLIRSGLYLVFAVVLALGALAGEGGLIPAPLTVPGGAAGIGFDDIGFAPSIRRVLVPAGRSGNLDLIDPDTRQVTAISGFSIRSAFGRGHAQGVTSADEGRGLLFATDRDAKQLDVVDSSSRSIVASARLGSGPDYVRFVAPTGEVWVTEPRAAGIEVFSIPESGPPQPAHAAFVSIAGGPESLIVDKTRGRAYTNLRSDTTLAIDLKTRAISAQWKNGCRGSNGLAMDDAHGVLFVGCGEGKLSVLDLATGALLGEASSGDGVDIIAYNPRLSHVYLPGAKSATMAIVGISAREAATVLATVKTAPGAHCVAADDRDQAYVCDPLNGRLLVFKDSLPASRALASEVLDCSGCGK